MDMQFSDDNQARRQKTHYAAVMAVFALVCFITSMVLNTSVGKPITIRVPANGEAKPHPITIPRDRSVYKVEVKQSTASMRDNVDWSAVSCEVQNQKGEYLFGFGDEFWRASGYDEGYWSEHKNNYGMKMTFPKKGTYLLAFDTERSNPGISEPIDVTVTRKTASAMPFLWAGIISLITSVLLVCVANPQIFENLSE